MKFSTIATAAAPAASAQVKKPFDFAAAEEALAVSFERFNDAAMALAATTADCDKLLAVVDDSKHAVEVFHQFGAEHLEVCLGVFNGKSGMLDKALGMESLTAEVLAKMDTAKKALVKDQYCSALEANVGEAFKAFWEKVKAWLANFIQWAKELFVGNAKLLKLVQETKFENIDQEAQFAGVTAENAKKLQEYLGAHEMGMRNMVGLWKQIKEAADNEAAQKPLEEFNTLGNTMLKKGEELVEKNGGKPLTAAESGTVGSLGWTEANIKAVKDAMAGMLNNVQVKDLMKEFQVVLAESINSSINGDKDKVEGLRGKFAAALLGRTVVFAYNKAARNIAVTLLRLAKKTKEPAAAPSASAATPAA